jgi:hypothetical protein
MTASPDLQAAIRAGCEIGTRCDYPACGGSCPSRVTVTCALRSLATPTPEVIEAMALAMVRDDPVALGMLTKAELQETARAALAAYWSSILGEKP